LVVATVLPVLSGGERSPFCGSGARTLRTGTVAEDVEDREDAPPV